MFRSLARRRIPGTVRSRWIVSAVALAAAAGLVVSQVTPARVAGHRVPGLQAAGSSGSLQHHPWWDPQGWFAGGGTAPGPRVLAGNVAAVPAAGRMPRQAAMRPVRRVRELTGKRDRYTRVFQLSDGRLQAVVSGVPVNYRDAAGRWQPIDTTVTRATAPGYLYGNASNTFGSLFGAAPGRLVRFAAPGGGWLTIGLTSGTAGRPRVSGDSVTYAGVAPGVDVSYQVTPTALKERITLASAAAAASLASLPFVIRTGGGLIPYQRPDGSIALARDGAGGPPVLIMPKPFMTDAAADARSPYGAAWSPRVAQQATWDQATGAMRLTVTADAGWLRQPARKFPVVVDPTISIAPTPTDAQNTMIISDSAQASTNFNSSWRLSVGTDSGGAVRSLLSFPLGAVPAGTQLDSADLNLYYDQNFGSPGSNETIEAHQATAPWSASTATWANAGNNVGQLGNNQVVTDDSATASTSASGAWPTAVTSSAVNGEYRYDQDTTSGDTFTWVPRLTESGSYQVEAHYVASSTAASNAPYTVYYNGGSQSYTVNQQSGSGGVWATMGTQPFAAGTTGKIVLGDGPASASTMVEADAVRLTKPGSVVFDPNANTWDVFSVRNIVQSWLDGTSPNYGFVVKDANESTLNQGGPRYEASRFAYNGETATYPQLVLTYGTPGVTLNPITTIHATGADLSWPAYTDPTPGTNPADDIAEYQVYRSVFQSFTPSASTMVAPVAAGMTSFTDTTNTPTPPGNGALGNAFYYMVAVKTQDGMVIPGPVQLVRLPTAGSTTQIINAFGDTTLSSGQPTTNEQQFAGGPYLGVGDNSATYGVTRVVAGFPSLASAGIPAGSTVTDAELKLWGWYNLNTGGGTATYEAHALTQSFDPATATWNNASSGTTWTTAGGAYSATVSGTVSGLTNDPNRQEWPVTAMAQDWLNNPADEHGLLVKLSGETKPSPQERELFLNSNGVEPKLRPELVVTYLQNTAQDTYYAPSLPDPLTASGNYTVNVTLTNSTAATWSASDWVLSYHWLLPDGTDVSSPANQAQTALPAGMAPSAVATIAATLKTPDNTGDPHRLHPRMGSLQQNHRHLAISRRGVGERGAAAGPARLGGPANLQQAGPGEVLPVHRGQHRVWVVGAEQPGLRQRGLVLQRVLQPLARVRHLRADGLQLAGHLRLLDGVRLVAGDLHPDAAGHTAGLPPPAPPHPDHAHRRGRHEPPVRPRLERRVAKPTRDPSVPAATGRLLRQWQGPGVEGVGDDPAGPYPVLLRLPGLPVRRCGP